MIFTQYYLDCLSQASYLIGDETTGKAVIVDPRRDITEYLEDAKAQNLEIVGVLNTHFHADFISGHLELAGETGAWIGYGPNAQADFEIRNFADGERIELGDVVLEVMHTPGHTPESMTVLVYEHAGDVAPYGALTGDALFIGDVGRPDLLASIGVTAHELGGMLFDSIQNKLMGLPDETRVFPAHGAGSACGKNLSTEKQSTIGQQRRENYACQPMSEDQFIDIVTEGQPSAPEYFVYNAILNRKERGVRETYNEAPGLTGEQVDEALANGAVLLDARDMLEYAAGHLRGSISVPADGRLAETVGMVLTPEQPVVVLADDGLEQETVIRLERIGYDKCLGYVLDADAFLEARADRIEHASRLTVPAAMDALQNPDVQLVDIRNAGELVNGVIPNSTHIPLAELRRRAGELDAQKPVLLYCAGGWRSNVGASLLEREGFADVSDLLGGHDAWALMAPA
ncbi:MAG: rhodanese-like domain-containing protein [Nocardioides sp.]